MEMGGACPKEVIDLSKRIFLYSERGSLDSGCGPFGTDDAPEAGLTYQRSISLVPINRIRDPRLNAQIVSLL